MSDKLTVDLFQLSSNQIDALCRARMLGKTSGHKLLDSLADGGAQLLRSIGKEEYKMSPLFELTTEENLLMQQFFADPELQKPIKIQLKEREISY